MKAEEKQALIKFCNTVVSDIKSDAVAHEDEIVMNTLQIFEIALAALTAQPVNLSNCRTLWYDHDDLSAEVKCIPVKDIKKAIRAAGYEVQE